MVRRRFTQHTAHPIAQRIFGIHGTEEVSLQKAQFQYIRFESGLNHSPGMGEAQPGNAFRRPGRLRGLLLELPG